MEKEYFNSEFEQFLKENADQNRMYPSEKVWYNINSNLHFRSRIFGFGFTVLMLSLGTISIYLLNDDKMKIANITSTELVMPADLILNNTNNTLLYSDNNIISQKADKVTLSSSKKTIESHTPTNVANAIARTQNTVTEKESIQNESAETSIAEKIMDETVSLENQLNVDLNVPETIAKINELPIAIPNAIDNAINELKIGKPKANSSFQLYFSPTITYRKLSENKSYLLNGSNSSIPNYLNVKDLVSHKADIGFEFGLTKNIPLSKKLNLRAGIQFNVSRYSIKAFNIPGEIATYALNRGTRVDSLSMLSSYRNNQSNGFNPDKLENFYFQISAPIGVEYLFAQKNNVKFGIAGTIQPSYLLQDRIYLLSVDYKNYNEVPWLVRKVNANTSLETFVSYSSGQINWQIGPQVRYQLLSSFVDKYPVKENLFNFGFKIAATLNK